MIRDQAKDLEQLLNERDILGAQLVRRNDEIALLHEKINIFQSTLERGENFIYSYSEMFKLLVCEKVKLNMIKGWTTLSC